MFEEVIGRIVFYMIPIVVIEIVVYLSRRYQAEIRKICDERTETKRKLEKITLQRNHAIAEVERLREILGSPPYRSDDPWRG